MGWILSDYLSDSTNTYQIISCDKLTYNGLSDSKYNGLELNGLTHTKNSRHLKLARIVNTWTFGHVTRIGLTCIRLHLTYIKLISDISNCDLNFRH